MGAVPLYFDLHFETAVALYSCGTGLGITIMPIIAQELLDIYGWRGTLVLLSALCAHTVLFGTLIKFETKYKEADPLLDGSNCYDSTGGQRSNINRPSEGNKSNGKQVGQPLHGNTSNGKRTSEIDKPIHDSISDVTQTSEIEQPPQVKNNGTLTLEKEHLLSGCNSNETPKSETERPLKKTHSNGLNSSRLRILFDLLDFPLLTDFLFFSHVLVPSFAMGYTFTGWAVYVVSYAVSNGATIQQASIISMCGGIGITIIRLILPILHKVATYKHLLYIGTIIAAISLALITRFVCVFAMALFSTGYGVSYGIFGAEILIAIREVTAESRYFSGVAWHTLFEGAGAASSGLLTGKISDGTFGQGGRR